MKKGILLLITLSFLLLYAIGIGAVQSKITSFSENNNSVIINLNNNPYYINFFSSGYLNNLTFSFNINNKFKSLNNNSNYTIGNTLTDSIITYGNSLNNGYIYGFKKIAPTGFQIIQSLIYNSSLLYNVNYTFQVNASVNNSGACNAVSLQFYMKNNSVQNWNWTGYPSNNYLDSIYLYDIEPIIGCAGNYTSNYTISRLINNSVKIFNGNSLVATKTINPPNTYLQILVYDPIIYTRNVNFTFSVTVLNITNISIFGQLNITNNIYNISNGLNSINITQINNILNSSCFCNGCIANLYNCSIPINFNINEDSIVNCSIYNLTYSYGIDNCSYAVLGIPTNATALNITFYDYLNQNTYVNYAATTIFDYGNYSLSSASLNRTSLCVYPAWFNLSTLTQFQYIDSNSITYSYFLETNLNSNTQRLSLYTQTNTTLTLFTVYDIDQNPLIGYKLYILKYNVGTGTYTLTEILETDSQGHAVGNIILNTAYYNFLIYDTSNNLVGSENGVRLTSTAYTFTVSSAEDAFYTDLSNAMGVNYNLYFNNDTNNVVFTWSDPAGAMHQACLKVDSVTYLGKTTLSDTCTVAAAGTILYNIPILANETSYSASAYLKYDYPFPLKTIEIVGNYVVSFFAMDKFNSLFIALILLCVGILIGLPNINYSFIYFAIVIVITSILKLWFLTLPMVGSLIVLGFIVVYIGGKQQ